MFTLPVKRIIFLAKFLLTVCLISYVLHASLFTGNKNDVHRRYPPQEVPSYRCLRTNETWSPAKVVGTVNMRLRPNADEKVLIFVETAYSKLGKQIIGVVDALKIPKKVETLSKNLPLLTTSKRGRFALVIIENYYKYLNLSSWNRQLLDKYCRDYNVGIISFLSGDPTQTALTKMESELGIRIKMRQRVTNLHFSPDSRVPFIGKPGAVLETPEPDIADWTIFDVNENSECIVAAHDQDGIKYAAVILDDGSSSNVEKILFGHNLTHWINKIAFLDAIRYFGKILMLDGLERYIQIDIDDIFVGTSGSRMIRADVDALFDAQNRLRKFIRNFKFCLGFSGFYFRSGDQLEDEGDERLIEIGHNFLWFPHMWRHNHAHEHNQTYLEAIMTQNKLFAKSLNLPAFSGYVVSPQHAGVYPVHEPLYNAWKTVWNIVATSTEEYPHFRPASARRGFIHKNISVLPRQTCGLYTHTQFFHSYPGGFSKLLNNIEGGDLLFTILVNPFSIFMTHQQNYANDRLGSFTFERVMQFIKCWTNLRLIWEEPAKIASLYFTRFPTERIPFWSNPCTDQRHAKILAREFNCSDVSLPNLLIVGPQKTGSTALGTFLALHPKFSTNDAIPGSFEELQFFGGANYGNGIKWYANNFASKMDREVIFEKSATYFDNMLAPKAAASLLPKANIVVVLLDPVVRAYSWYQHMRFHNDSVALSYTFHDIMKNDPDLPLAVRRFRNRCISPGRYVHHLERWLEYYPMMQIHLIDGEELRHHPAAVVSQLVDRLHAPEFPFDRFIKFDKRKGFFCAVIDDVKKCLGISKGRKYEALDEDLKRNTDLIFKDDNIALHKFLLKNNLRVPIWLQKLLSQTLA